MLATLASKAQEPGFLSQIINLISTFSARSAMGATAGNGSSAVSGSVGRRCLIGDLRRNPRKKAVGIGFAE